MVSDLAGTNYFGVRLETALQYARGRKDNGLPKYHNLLGSVSTGRLTEQQERDLHHKWSPVRHHQKSFPNGRQFDGNNFWIYARAFSRGLHLYRKHHQNEVPELESVFVLTIGTGDPADDLYQEAREELASFVESAVIDPEIIITDD